MKLGVHIGYWGLGLTSADQLGIFKMRGRSAAMTAMTAATIDQLSDGRMLLGIGTSGPQVSEGWHGVRFGKQLARTRDYVAVIRMVLAREKLIYKSDTLELPLPNGPGKPLKLLVTPVRENIPIYIAAMGPKNTELAGEIADGWLPFILSPEHLPELAKNLETGAAKSGRSLENFDIAPTVNMYISDDRAKARDMMRPVLGLYIGGMGSKEKNFYAELVGRYGFEAEAAKVQDLFLSGQREEAMAALPDELIDLVSLCGPEDVVLEQLRKFKAAGVGTLSVLPMAWEQEDRIAQTRTLADLFAK